MPFNKDEPVSLFCSAYQCIYIALSTFMEFWLLQRPSLSWNSWCTSINTRITRFPLEMKSGSRSFPLATVAIQIPIRHNTEITDWRNKAAIAAEVDTATIQMKSMESAKIKSYFIEKVPNMYLYDVNNLYTENFSAMFLCMGSVCCFCSTVNTILRL